MRSHSGSNGQHHAGGLQYYQRDDGIHVFRFIDSLNETVDAWAKRVLETESAAGAKAHVRSLYDIRGQWITAYAMQTMFRMSRLTVPRLMTSVAVVGDGLVLASVRMVLAHLPHTGEQARQIFTTETAALHWLDERGQMLSPDRPS